jgi:hypothetical protein
MTRAIKTNSKVLYLNNMYNVESIYPIYNCSGQYDNSGELLTLGATIKGCITDPNGSTQTRIYGHMPLAELELVVSAVSLTPETSSQTDIEDEVLDLLSRAWNVFNKLEPTHPMHKDEFCKGIHDCQAVLTHRIVQRDDPDKFPTHTDKD